MKVIKAIKWIADVIVCSGSLIALTFREYDLAIWCMLVVIYWRLGRKAPQVSDVVEAFKALAKE